MEVKLRGLYPLKDAWFPIAAKMNKYLSSLTIWRTLLRKILAVVMYHLKHVL